MRRIYALGVACGILAAALIFVQLRGNSLQSALRDERARSNALAKELEELRSAKVPGAKPAIGGRGPATAETRAPRPKSTPKPAEKEEPDPFMQKVLSHADYASAVYEFMQESPGGAIPELRLLETSQWMGLADKLDPSLPEDEQLKASAEAARTLAVSHALNMMVNAGKRAAEAGTGVPGSPADLAPYLAEPLGQDILDRYTIVQRQALPREIASNLENVEQNNAKQGMPVPRTEYVVMEKEAAGRRGYAYFAGPYLQGSGFFEAPAQ